MSEKRTQRVEVMERLNGEVLRITDGVGLHPLVEYENSRTGGAPGSIRIVFGHTKCVLAMRVYNCCVGNLFPSE